MPNENPHIANSLLNSFKAFVGSHFLLNIINSIQSDIILKNDKSAFDILQRFNRIYKLSLRASNDQLISLQDELSFCNEYIGLEQIRFPKSKISKIDLKKIDVDLSIPTYVFQSLLENAILLSLEISSSKPQFICQTNDNNVSLHINLDSNSQYHPKVKTKVDLALSRLEMLKQEQLIDYDLTWQNDTFMSLTIHLK
jgi:LytS/YehU family sensor histidine kinase